MDLDLDRRRLIGGVLALPWLGAQQVARATPAARGEPVAWPAALTLLDGSRLQPGAWRGQAVVVVFFSTTCAYCARHNPRIEKLRQAAQGLPLTVIGVAHDRSAAPVRDYLQRHGLGFAATLDEQPLHAALSERRVMPLTCVVDRGGVLREVIPGEMAEDDVLGLIKWARA